MDRVVLGFGVVFLVACGGGAGPRDGGAPDGGARDGGARDAGEPDAGTETRTFHCGFDEGCPEVTIDGDPLATVGAMPSPFRGYADPSLEADPATGALFLSYSWLDVLIGAPGPPPVVDLGVRTHLARSDDGGASFRFVRAVNTTERTMDPADQWSLHEVSTLVAGPDGWELLWLEYAEPVGPEERRDYHLPHAVASAPEALGDAIEPWIGTTVTPASVAAPHRLHESIPELSDCTVLTEPALFAHGGALYLAIQCIVISGATRDLDRDRIVLLRWDTARYAYVGELLGRPDAAALGADVLTQPDLSVGRDGTVLLLATPKVIDADPQHRGCVVYEVPDLAAAAVRREAGAAFVRARITADGNGLGPGLCTYDAASASGVMVTLTRVDLVSTPPDILFSLRATGLHP